MATSFILLDRDGTLIKHTQYLIEPNRVEFLPNVVEGLTYMKELGFTFGIITNQSLISRGLGTREEVDSVNARVLSLLEDKGLTISFVLVCPHAPSDLCDCRKPLPQLGNIAREQYGIDVSASYMIGDANSDILFGQGIGCRTIQIIESPDHASSADYATIDLLTAAEYIHSQMKRV